MAPTNLSSFQERFITLAGDMAEMVAFSRSVGQLYGLLYITPEPMSLEEIARTCKMSKGNASIHLRILEGWGAVHRSCKPGTRKDYYIANQDLRGLAIKRFQEGIQKRLDLVRSKFKTIEEDSSFKNMLKDPGGDLRKRRFEEIEALLKQFETALTLIPKLSQLQKFFL